MPFLRYSNKSLSVPGPQGPKGDPGLTTSVNGVEQVEGNVQVTAADIPSGVKPEWTVADGLLAAKKTYVSFENPFHTQTQGRMVGDRWVIPSRQVKNMIPSNLFSSANVSNSDIASGMTVTYEGTKVSVAIVNTATGAGFRLGMIETKPPDRNLIATHVYYIAAMGSAYRTAASGTFEKGSACQINISGHGDIGVAGLNSSEDGLPVLKANAKTMIDTKIFTAKRDMPVVLSLFYTLVDTARIGSTTSGTTYFDVGDILLIDLTEIFGAGNEPKNTNISDSLFLTGAWWGDGFPYDLNMRMYFNEVQFGGKAAICTEKEGFGMWGDIPLLTMPRLTYATAAAGFSFVEGYPKYCRFGSFVYFEIQCTISTAMTAGQVKALTTNAMMPLPAMPGKFQCYSSVNTHQLFLQMTRTEDNIVQLSLQSIAAAAASTMVAVNGIYLADDYSHDNRMV